MQKMPETIEEVLQELDNIIDQTVASNNFLGIFAYVYRRTTAQIKLAVENKTFEDNARMEKFDVAFANLYLAAYHSYQNRQSLSKSWQTAFDAQSERLTSIQHLIMGMNAHINLDLGVAAATVMRGQPIQLIENDFRKVNQILADLTEEMQERLTKISPLMFVLDWIGEKTDERIVNFSIREAREQSWRNAKLIWALDEPGRQAGIDGVDEIVAGISAIVRNPRTRLSRFILRWIAYFEEKNVEKIVGRLRG